MSCSSNEGGCERECVGVLSGETWASVMFAFSWTLCGLLQFHCLGPLMSLRLLLTYLPELHVGRHNGEAKEATYFYTNFPL